MMLSDDNLIKWDGRSPFYEVYYLRLVDPITDLFFWLRFVLVAFKGGGVETSLWAIASEEGEGYIVVKDIGLQVAAPACLSADRQDRTGRGFSPRSGSFQIAGGSFSGDRTAGSTQDGRVKWDINWRREISLREFPFDIMYRLPWPVSKLTAPNWSATAAGWIEVEGRRYTFDNARLHQGHHWGRNMARSWVWTYCNAFEGLEDAVFEGLASKVFGVPITILIFRWGGDLYRGVQFCPSPFTLSPSGRGLGEGGYRFEVGCRGIRLKGEIAAPKSNPISLTYDAPDGSTRTCRHWPFADARIEIYERGSLKPTTTLSSKHASFEVVA